MLLDDARLEAKYQRLAHSADSAANGDENFRAL